MGNKRLVLIAFGVLCFLSLFARPGGAKVVSGADAQLSVMNMAAGELRVLSGSAGAVYPGEAFLARVTAPGLESASFIWLGKTHRVAARTGADGAGTAQIFLPVPYEEKPGKTAILRVGCLIRGEEVSLERKLPVAAKKYPEQTLSVDSRFVRLNSADLERSKKERAETRPVLDRFSPESAWQVPFVRPVPGNLKGGVSSRFGLRRVFNGEPRGYHRGLDLRGAEGTPIRACADGVVAIAANHFFSGNVVYVDHGEGVVTMYAHMSKIAVRSGERVKAGDILGYVGSTGRVTGPHLHLGLSVQGVLVDAQPFLEKDPPEKVSGPKGKKGAPKRQEAGGRGKTS